MLESNRCLVCCQDLRSVQDARAHSKCLRALFDSPEYPRLDVDASQLHLLGLEMAGRTSLSGVQQKIALGLDHEVLRVSASPSQYILKPTEDRFPNLPENEHLCMRLAMLMKFEVPPVGLIPMSDERLALIVRRFDRTGEGGKLPMEDLCQLSERLPAEKYNGSAELCAKTVKRYSAAPPLDLRELFRLFLFSWWIGNGDLHLKNISLLTRERGEPRLSPVYDLVNTSLVIPGDQLALTIAGKRSNFRAADWIDFAQRCELPLTVVADLAVQLAKRTREGLNLIRRSFLPSASRAAFAWQFVERADELIDLARAADRASSKPPKTAAPERLTGERAAWIRLELDSQLQHIGIASAQSGLGASLAELDWLSKTSGDVFADSGPFDTDGDRAVSAFVHAIRCDRLLRSLERAKGTPGVERVGRHLKQLHADPGHEEEGAQQAQDHLFQLEVGAMLKTKWWQIEYELDDTDIVIVGADSTRFGLECKRPRKQDSVARNVREGIEQLRSRGLGGLVVVSLDQVLPARFFTLQKGERVEPAVSHLLADAVRPIEESVMALLPSTRPSEHSIEGAIFGVLFCASPFLSRALESGDHRVAVRFGVHALLNPALSDFEEFVGFLRNVLLAGERELWLNP